MTDAADQLSKALMTAVYSPTRLRKAAMMVGSENGKCPKIPDALNVPGYLFAG